MRYGSERRGKQKVREIFLFVERQASCVEKVVPPTNVFKALCNTATSTQCLVRFYLICVCAKGCYVNKGINSPRMIMHLILCAERLGIQVYSVFLSMLLSLYWVLDHYYHYRLQKGSIKY
ncbi:hypothetical protein V8G54_001258 [Vigna mungo]|uniref:Uncharacterized protein n=1 Tax=Vigna mungo TaxID=3915 RepID=A0AAQ3SBM3_VIGMU